MNIGIRLSHKYSGSSPALINIQTMLDIPERVWINKTSKALSPTKTYGAEDLRTDPGKPLPTLTGYLGSRQEG
jgi:hypothetical protein